MNEQPLAPQASVQAEPPVPVVKVLSVRGVEYGLMTFMLWLGAASVIWCLIAIIHGEANFENLSFPAALLVSCLPIFAALFIRLRRAELADPRLRLEASKRRWSQTTQFVAFFVCFFNIVGFVYALMSKAGSEGGGSLLKQALSLLAVLAVAGGIFAYYWFDEHRAVKAPRG